MLPMPYILHFRTCRLFTGMQTAILAAGASLHAVSHPLVRFSTSTAFLTNTLGGIQLMNTRIGIGTLFTLMLCTLAGCEPAPPTNSNAPVQGTSAAKTDGGKKPRIAVIPKGTTHVFWKSVEKGARRAGEKHGVEVIWKGPIVENDRDEQIKIVQQFEGVDGVALAPLDYKALVGSVKEKKTAGVPVVIFDSALDGEAGIDFVSFVATDNEMGGKLGGEQLVKLLGDKKKVVLLRYQPGSASTDSRENGFLGAAKKADLEVLVDNQYAGATIDDAKTKALEMIDTLKKADGIFTPNESSTMGMLLALEQEGLAGKVKFVGFDASPLLVKALRDGKIDALVVQNPDLMGYKAVEVLVDKINGKTVEEQVDTGVVVVTRDNMDDPEIKPLLQ